MVPVVLLGAGRVALVPAPSVKVASLPLELAPSVHVPQRPSHLKTHIHDAQDSMAKRQVAAQEMAEQIEALGGPPNGSRTIRFM